MQMKISGMLVSGMAGSRVSINATALILLSNIFILHISILVQLSEHSSYRRSQKLFSNTLVQESKNHDTGSNIVCCIIF